MESDLTDHLWDLNELLTKAHVGIELQGTVGEERQSPSHLVARGEPAAGIFQAEGPVHALTSSVPACAVAQATTIFTAKWLVCYWLYSRKLFIKM